MNNDSAVDIAVGISSASISILTGVPVQRTSAEYAYLYTAEGARSAMDLIDAALSRVANEKGMMGSFQSRLKSALATLTTSRENYKAAEARITDADIALESSKLISSQIRQQLGQSVLAQANQIPALVLELLEVA